VRGPGPGPGPVLVCLSCFCPSLSVCVMYVWVCFTSHYDFAAIHKFRMMSTNTLSQKQTHVHTHIVHCSLSKTTLSLTHIQPLPSSGLSRAFSQRTPDTAVFSDGGRKVLGRFLLFKRILGENRRGAQQ